MKQYKYIGESNSFLTKNKIYEIKKDNNFIDDIGCINYLGSLLNENFKEIKPCSIVESVRKQLLDRSKFYFSHNFYLFNFLKDSVYINRYNIMI